MNRTASERGKPAVYGVELRCARGREVKDEAGAGGEVCLHLGRRLRAVRLLREGRRRHREDALRVLRVEPGPRTIAERAENFFAGALAPLEDGDARNTDLFLDRRGTQTLGTEQDDSRSVRQTLACRGASLSVLQLSNARSRSPTSALIRRSARPCPQRRPSPRQ